MHFNLGDVKENTTYTSHIYVEDKDNFRYGEPSCGCMTLKYDKSTGRLTMKYSTGILGIDTIKLQGFQQISRYITLYYKDNKTIKVQVTGRILPK